MNEAERPPPCAVSRTVLIRTEVCEVHRIPIRQCELNQTKTLLARSVDLLDRASKSLRPKSTAAISTDVREFLRQKPIRSLLHRDDPGREAPA